MAVDLLSALEDHGYSTNDGRPNDFTFQHRLCHDFESLIWVIIYAMMVQRRNVLAVTDSKTHADYKGLLDDFWGAHSYSKLMGCHINLMGSGAIRSRTIVEKLLFSDPLEAEFFRAAMQLVLFQTTQEGQSITYEKMQALFRTYIQKAEQATVSTLAPA